MNKIEELQKSYMLFNYKVGKIDSCINWAIDRLEHNEEDGDENIVLLAGEIDQNEARYLTKKILDKYQPSSTDDEFLCGKYIVELYRKYYEKEIDIHKLDFTILKLYSGLNYPDWLVMLSRNCEYATDIEAFYKPFQDEFEYIVSLWKDSKSITEFYNKYDRNVSNSHDLKNS